MPVSPMENGWGRALPPGSFDPAATIEKKGPPSTEKARVFI